MKPPPLHTVRPVNILIYSPKSALGLQPITSCVLVTSQLSCKTSYLASTRPPGKPAADPRAHGFRGWPVLAGANLQIRALRVFHGHANGNASDGKLASEPREETVSIDAFIPWGMSSRTASPDFFASGCAGDDCRWFSRSISKDSHASCAPRRAMVMMIMMMSSRIHRAPKSE